MENSRQEADNKGNECKEGQEMFLWMVAGYVLAAIGFYSYIVATAQEEPQERAVVIDMNEWQRSRDESLRKAA